jgi:hypothetical protein
MFFLPSNRVWSGKLTGRTQFEENRLTEKSVKRGIEANEETLDA